MNILVTGGAGYIGSVLVLQLLELGNKVTVVDDFRYGNAFSLAPCCVYSGFRMINGDVRDARMMAKLAVYRFDTIIALAAIVGAPACDRNTTEAVTINVNAIVELQRSFGSTPVIYPNTNSGYGSSVDICTEDSPINPLSIYAKTKAQAEKAVLDNGGVSLRLATVFGMSPRMRLDLMVNDFVMRAIRDNSITLYEAHYRRNFIHVRDVAEAFIFAMNNYSRMAGGAYNVGQDSANMTKLQLCERITHHYPSFRVAKMTGRDVDQRDYEVSNAKIMALGWRAEYSIDDGIRELLVGLRGVPAHQYGNA